MSEQIERLNDAARNLNAAATIAELRLQLQQQQDEVRRLREELAEAKAPDMWWDPESPEDAISDPQEAFDDDQFAGAGDTFRLWCAKRIPDQIYTITGEGDDLSYRDATPEEAAEHIACEKAEKARRKAEMDAENARRRAALTPTATPAKEPG